MAVERIQKIIAAAGISSRRDAEVLIKSGRVRVNGNVATLGDSADPTKDQITVNHKTIAVETKEYLLLHKPAGYITTLDDPQKRKTVLDLVHSKARLFPVGRLDYDTEGLLIFTNDGDFANLLMHPRYSVTKDYEVTLDKPLHESTIEKIANKPRVEGKPVDVLVVSAHRNTITVRIHEGRKHIVKNIFALFGLRVTRLLRTAIGPIRIGSLARGKTRPLTLAEVKALTLAAHQQ